MQVNAHLHFQGECEAAFRFYERLLGGRIVTMLTYSSSPAAGDVPAEWADKILHATLEIGGHRLMGADTPPGRFQKPQGFAVTLGLQDAAEAERIFQALSAGGAVQLSLQETFWAQRFGMLVDRYGIPWMINCGRAA